MKHSKASRLAVATLGLVLMAPWFANAQPVDENPSALAMIGDLVIARPLLVVATAAGAARGSSRRWPCSRLLEMPHALGATRGVDFVDILARVDRLVGASRFAHIAVDALRRDQQGHGARPSGRIGKFLEQGGAHARMHELRDVAL